MQELVLAVAAAALTMILPATARASEPAVLFEHVNVVPMDRDRILTDRSVLVADGRIAAVGGTIAAPAGARIVDGHDLYLMPGLADMHVHSGNSRDMRVLLANGVTTVLNMGGASSDFVDQVVPAINAGRRPGPHIYLALRVDGTPEYGQLVVTSPEQARAVVGLARTNGYDFIKVYNNLAPAVFEAFVDEGRRQGIPVVGHGVTRVGIERQLAAGQLMVAHLEEYLYTVFFPPGADVGTRAPDDSQIAAAVAFTRRSGAFVTADLGTYATIAGLWGHPEVTAGAFRDPGFAYLDPMMRIAWRQSGYETRSGDLGPRLRFLGRFAKALLDAGVPLIAGTDTPTITGDYPGASLRTDLYALQAAGFTAFQALSTATRTPGEFIARAKPGSACFGIVAVGCRADLLLLRRNPLADLHAIESREGVMVGGAWRGEAQLQALLAEVAQIYRDAFTP